MKGRKVKWPEAFEKGGKKRRRKKVGKKIESIFETTFSVRGEFSSTWISLKKYTLYRKK